jgi:hypothetical protein
MTTAEKAAALVALYDKGYFGLLGAIDSGEALHGMLVPGEGRARPPRVAPCGGCGARHVARGACAYCGSPR